MFSNQRPLLIVTLFPQLPQRCPWGWVLPSQPCLPLRPCQTSASTRLRATSGTRRACCTTLARTTPRTLSEYQTILKKPFLFQGTVKIMVPPFMCKKFEHFLPNSIFLKKTFLFQGTVKIMVPPFS